MSDRQRQRALERANAARSQRADLKRRISDGEIDGPRMIRNGGELAGKLKAGEILTAIPGIGPTTRDELLEATGISASRRLAQIPADQRAMLADATEEAI
jgi:predicted flap endonuclease-1-like 5' DNA nuclease